MHESDLQQLCERGQIELMETRYLAAAKTLALAEHAAWEARSFDTLARLYLPLQEARRQIRQRCGEGAVRLHLFPTSPSEKIDPQQVVEQTSHGQVLVAGWNSIQPAVEVRRLIDEQQLYLETFLAAAAVDADGKSILKIFPVEDWPPMSDCLTLSGGDLPADAPKGTAETYAGMMALWERLHAPFLLTAKEKPDPIEKMQAYRFTLQVDPACELAHQFLADIARDLARHRR